MGLDAGKVVAYLTLNTSGFESGIATGRSLMKTLQKEGVFTSKGMAAIGDAMASTGKLMTLGLTTPLVGLGIAATTAFVSFDDAIRQVTATMEASEEETARLTEAAKQIGLTTQFSATQAAEALNALAAAGYDTEGAISALPTVLKLSAAAGIGLESAASMLTDSMSALGLGVSDMEGFVDQLAKGASVSNASIAQLGEAVLTVGGTAKILKGGTVELNAELGILANNGLKGAEGGTMLRNVINALSAPTDQAAKVMKQYNLEAFDAQGNFRGLNDIFADLAKVMDGWSDKDRASLMSELFNVRDLKAAEALMAGTTGLYEQFADGIENSQGAAQRFADTLSGGLSGSMDKLKAAVQGLGIEFGEDLAPMVKDLADWVTELTRGWASMDDGMQRTILTIAGVAAVVGPALIVLGKLTTAVSSLAPLMAGPGGWIALSVAGVAGLIGILSALDDKVRSSDEAIDRLVSDAADEDRVARMSAEVSLDVTITGDPQGTLDGAMENLRIILEGAEVFGDDSPVTAEDIAAAIRGEVEPISLALKAAGLDGTEATEAQATITTAVAGVHDVLAAVKSPLTDEERGKIIALIGQDETAIREALLGMGLTPTEIAAVEGALKSANGQINDALSAVDPLTDVERDAITGLINADAGEIKTALKGMGLTGTEVDAITLAIGTAKSGIYDACNTLGLGEGEADRIAGLVGKDAKTINDELKAMGLTGTELEAVTAAITAAGTTISTAVGEVDPLSDDDLLLLKGSCATESAALQAALKLMGLNEGQIADVLAIFTTLENTVAAGVPRLYDGIAAKLTDGLPDTDQDVAALKDEIKTKTQTLVDAVNASLNEEIAKLDPNTATYAADCESLKQDAAATVAELKRVETETIAWIDTNSGKATATVQQHLGELEALEQQFQTLANQIELTNAEAAQQKNAAVETVRAGATKDETTIDTAFSWTYQKYKTSDQALDDQYASDVAAQQKRRTSGEISDSEYASIEEDLRGKLAIDKAGLLSEYKTNLNELLLGVAEAYPEAAAAVNKALEAQDDIDVMTSVWDKVLEKGPGKLEGTDLTDEMVRVINEALGESFTADSLAQNINDYSWDLDYGVLTGGILTDASSKVRTAATEAINAEDFGELGETYASAVEAGLFTPFEDGYGADKIETFKGVFSGVGAAVPEGFSEGVDENAHLATESVEGMTGELEGAARGKLESNSPSKVFQRIGRDIVDGMIAGVKDRKDALTKEIEKLAAAAEKAARLRLDSHSPSRVFRRIGQDVSEGFALGVDDRLLSSQRVVERLVGVPASASKSTARSSVQPIDYDKLAAAVASRPVNLNLDGKTFAQATAVDNTRAVAERQRRLDIGKGLI